MCEVLGKTRMESSASFHARGCRIIRRSPSPTVTSHRRFVSFFGTSPSICEKLWVRLLRTRPSNANPDHLLWALMLLKLYDSEHVLSSTAGVDEKTFRKWAWFYVSLISKIQVVR